MERKIAIAAFLIVLVLLSPIFVSMKADTGPKPPKRGPKLIPEDEMPQPCFLKHGELPEFKDEGEETRWLELLSDLAKELEGPDVPYGGTLVVAHGMGGDGYYWVWVRDPKEVDQDVITTIAEEINRVAKEIGFDREVPIKFAQATGKGGYDKERDEPWETMIGGLQIRDIDRGAVDNLDARNPAQTSVLKI